MTGYVVSDRRREFYERSVRLGAMGAKSAIDHCWPHAASKMNDGMWSTIRGCVEEALIEEFQCDGPIFVLDGHAADVRNETIDEAIAVVRKAFKEGSQIPSQCAPWINGIITALQKLKEGE